MCASTHFRRCESSRSRSVAPWRSPGASISIGIDNPIRRRRRGARSDYARPRADRRESEPDRAFFSEGKTGGMIAKVRGTPYACEKREPCFYGTYETEDAETGGTVAHRTESGKPGNKTRNCVSLSLSHENTLSRSEPRVTSQISELSPWRGMPGSKRISAEAPSCRRRRPRSFVAACVLRPRVSPPSVIRPRGTSQITVTHRSTRNGANLKAGAPIKRRLSSYNTRAYTLELAAR